VKWASIPERVVPEWFLSGLQVLEDYLEVRALPETDAVLWTVVLLAGMFDIVTTMVGLGIGLQEGNAIARAFIATYGMTGIGYLKFSAYVILAAVWFRLPDWQATITLAVFGVISLLVVALNAISLLSV
jgi:hypothetical protein